MRAGHTVALLSPWWVVGKCFLQGIELRPPELLNHHLLELLLAAAAAGAAAVAADSSMLKLSSSLSAPLH